MAKQVFKTRSLANVTAGTDAKRSSKVKFGRVTIAGAGPSAAEVKINVQRSTEVLKRVGKTLASPGVSLRPKKDVPLFSVSEDDPGSLIRRLNGRVERGRLVDGSFRTID